MLIGEKGSGYFGERLKRLDSLKGSLLPVWSQERKVGGPEPGRTLPECSDNNSGVLGPQREVGTRKKKGENPVRNRRWEALTVPAKLCNTPVLKGAISEL